MEIRVAAYRSVQDIDRMIVMMQAQVSNLAARQKYVIAADWTKVGTMSPETATRAKEMLARSNPRVIRSAILTAPQRSAGNLQVMRLVREADNENRRHFTSRRDLCIWLGEVLTEPEHARLYEFLDPNAELARPAPTNPDR